jgi:hypothetical protein
VRNTGINAHIHTRTRAVKVHRIAPRLAVGRVLTVCALSAGRRNRGASGALWRVNEQAGSRESGLCRVLGPEQKRGQGTEAIATSAGRGVAQTLAQLPPVCNVSIVLQPLRRLLEAGLTGLKHLSDNTGSATNTPPAPLRNTSDSAHFTILKTQV